MEQLNSGIPPSGVAAHTWKLVTAASSSACHEMFSCYRHGQPCCCKGRSRLAVLPVAFTALFTWKCPNPWLDANMNYLKVGRCLGLRHHFRIVTGTGQNVGAQTQVYVAPKTRPDFPGCQLSGCSRYRQLRAFSDCSGICALQHFRQLSFLYLGALNKDSGV